MKTLALPEKTITPKPTRGEIISAMTRLKISKIAKEQKEALERRAALVEKAEKLVLSFVSKNLTKLGTRFCPGYSSNGKLYGATLDFQLRDLPENIAKLLSEIHALPSSYSTIRESEIRKGIADAMRGMAPTDQRVDALVSSPETRAALEKCLKEIGA